MNTTQEIEAFLKTKLEAQHFHHIPLLVRIISDAISHKVPVEAAEKQINSSHELAEAAQRVIGESITTSNAVIAFGSGSQMGELSTRDVAGRDIVNFMINVVSDLTTASSVNASSEKAIKVQSGSDGENNQPVSSKNNQAILTSENRLLKDLLGIEEDNKTTARHVEEPETDFTTIHGFAIASRNPIGCTIIVAMALIVISAFGFRSDLVAFGIFALNVLAVIAIALSIGFLSSALATKYFQVQPDLIEGIMWGAVLFAAGAAVISSFGGTRISPSNWALPVITSTILGVILGALFTKGSSLASEIEQVATKSMSTQQKWERAEKLGIENFKKRHSIYNWNYLLTEIIRFDRYSVQEIMIVVIYDQFGIKQGRYRVVINIEGEILDSRKSGYNTIDSYE